MFPQPRTFPAIFQAEVFTFGNIVVNSQQVLILAVALSLMVILTYIVQRTKIGKAMRTYPLIQMLQSLWELMLTALSLLPLPLGHH